MAAAQKNMTQDNLPSIDHLSAEQLTTLIDLATRLRSAKIERARQELIEEMRERAASLGLNFEALVSARAPKGTGERQKRSDAGRKMEPMFVGPKGETYAGRGPVPKWIHDYEAAGRNREEFRVR